jgi:hypothetical protein
LTVAKNDDPAVITQRVLIVVEFRMEKTSKPSNESGSVIDAVRSTIRGNVRRVVIGRVEHWLSSVGLEVVGSGGAAARDSARSPDGLRIKVGSA